MPGDMFVVDGDGRFILIQPIILPACLELFRSGFLVGEILGRHQSNFPKLNGQS